MTTTSLLPHKPPLKTRNPVFLRTSYYGSVGRPSNGRRKSAVELLQETKAFYVKSESVLDTKQELKNTDHLHVRSPTADATAASPSSSHYRHVPTTAGGHILPIFPIGTCPPYPHHHFDPQERSDLQREFEQLVQEHVSKREREKAEAGMMRKEMLKSNGFHLPKGGKSGTFSNNKTRSTSAGKTSSLRRSTLPPETLQLHIQMQHHDGVISLDGKNIIGLPLPLAFVHQNHYASPRKIDKHHSSTLPLIKSSAAPALPSHGNGKVDDDSPPPLPPKSPRTTSKPARPQDFPQRLPVQGGPDIQPPPPPRRLISHESDHYHESNIQSKLRRLLHDAPRGMSMPGGGGSSVPGSFPQSSSLSHPHPPNHAASSFVSQTTGIPPGDGSMGPITLPSPILPPTPPPDIAMESPMSDSGPIISPPPAFSTPVTPMLDRQNSSASEKSSQRQQHHPLSAAMSMVSVSISSASSGSNSRKSIPELSDVSMRYSPRSRSSSSPLSPDDNDHIEEDEDQLEADEDEEEPRVNNKIRTRTKSKTKHSSVILHQKIMPKSVTENALCKVSMLEMANPHRVSQQRFDEGSQSRRPILRSKSDLSHRYIKSGSSSNLISGGFTLVQVDLGLPPPLPPHQNNLSQQPPPPPVYNNFQQQTQPSELQNSYSNTLPRENTSPATGNRRGSRSSVELERFFDKLGLDNSSPPPVGASNPGDRSATSSPVFFSSVSSVDSGPRRGGSVDSGDSPLGVKLGSRTVGGTGYNPVTVPPTSTSSSNLVVQHGEPSIVERNARVIKWLFNCRKALDKR